MKNLILFLIAVSIGTFTFFYQELGDRRAFVEKEKEGQILNLEKLGKLKGFRLPNVDLLKKKEGFIFTDSGVMADDRRIDWFMEILAGVKIKRVIPLSERKDKVEDDFFPNKEDKFEFVFEGGEVTFLMGKKLDFDRSFYMKVITNDGEEKVVVAFDSGDHEAIYDKSQAHRSDHHFKRLQSLLHLKADFFRDYRIFRHWMKKKWSLLEVEFLGGRNRDYSVNFPEAKTFPSSPQLLGINRKAFLELEKNLSQLEGKAFLYKGKLFNELPPLVNIVVNASAGEARLSLYPNPKDSEEYILNSSLDGHSYRVSKKDSLYLLAPLSEYWDLRPLKHFPQELKLVLGGNSYVVGVKRKDGRFFAQSNKKKAIHASFKGLIDFLSRRADYWTVGEEIAENSIKQFEVDWGLGVFFLMVRSGEVVLYHKESKEALVYKIDGGVPVKVLGSEYFYE